MGKQKIPQNPPVNNTGVVYNKYGAIDSVNAPIDEGTFHTETGTRRFEDPKEFGRYKAMNKLLFQGDVRGSTMSNYDQEEQAALNQTGWGRAKNHALMFGANLNSAYIGGVLGEPSMILGAGEAIATQNYTPLYNDYITRKLNDITEYAAEHATNFYTHDEQKAAWWENALPGGEGSASAFWGVGLESAGFILGTLGAEATLGLITAESLGTASIVTVPSMAIAGKRLANFLKKGADAVDLVQDASRGLRALEGANKEYNMTKKIGQTIRQTYEAKTEAASFMSTAKYKAQEDFYNIHGRDMNEQEMAELDSEISKAGLAVFGANALVTGVLNEVTGLDKVFGYTDNVIEKMFPTKTLLKEVTDASGKKTAQYVSRTGELLAQGKYFKAAAPMLVNKIGTMFNEGIQEGLQSMSANIGQAYIDSKYDPLKKEATFHILDAIKDEMSSLTDVDDDKWMDFAIGAFSAGFGMPFSKRSQADYEAHHNEYLKKGGFTKSDLEMGSKNYDAAIAYDAKYKAPMKYQFDPLGYKNRKASETESAAEMNFAQTKMNEYLDQYSKGLDNPFAAVNEAYTMNEVAEHRRLGNIMDAKNLEHEALFSAYATYERNGFGKEFKDRYLDKIEDARKAHLDKLAKNEPIGFKTTQEVNQYFDDRKNNLEAKFKNIENSMESVQNTYKFDQKGNPLGIHTQEKLAYITSLEKDYKVRQEKMRKEVLELTNNSVDLSILS